MHFAVILLWLGTFGMLEPACAVAIFSSYALPNSLVQGLAILSIGILSFCAQSCIILALKVEKAAVVAIFRKATDIIAAFSIQILYFKVSSPFISF